MSVERAEHGDVAVADAGGRPNGAGGGAEKASTIGRKGPMSRKEWRGDVAVANALKSVPSGVSKRERSDKKLRASLRSLERRAEAATRVALHSATLHTEKAGAIVPESPLERTYKLRQSDIVGGGDTASARRAALQLSLADTGLGPYSAVYSRSGKRLLLYGERGHVSLLDWRRLRSTAELRLGETVRGGCFLHDDGLFALAQRKHVAIYDAGGLEVHTLRAHADPTVLTYLPWHYLLVSCSEVGMLTYTDTSTGDIVAELRTDAMGGGGSRRRAGRATALALNPGNACVLLGHSTGVVSMWSPANPEPLARVLVHGGAVSAVAVDATGRHMLTAGTDSRVCVWDLRTFQKMRSWLLPTPATNLSFSQRGLLAASFGPHLRVYAGDVLATATPSSSSLSRGNAAAATAPVAQVQPYLSELFAGRPVQSLSFCPYEDVLGVGHAEGFSTLLIPGAGEPNFDSALPNPYERRRQRREREVSALLEKLPPESIMLDASRVGAVDDNLDARLHELRARQGDAERAARGKSLEKRRTRRRNRLAERLRRKQQNVVDEKSREMRERLEKERRERARKARAVEEQFETDRAKVSKALQRFVRRSDD